MNEIMVLVLWVVVVLVFYLGFVVVYSRVDRIEVDCVVIKN